MAGLQDPKKRTLDVTSAAFGQDQPIPARFTCKGKDVSPPLTIGAVPPKARALALILDDPDAPRGTWTHWTAWNVPPTMTVLTEGVDLSKDGARQGTTSAASVGYHGPCPPSGTHRYFTRIYALDAPLSLPEGATRDQLERAMADHVLAWGEVMGTFAKS